MAATVDMSEEEESPGFDVEVEWVGFDKSENSWESLLKILRRFTAIRRIRAAQIGPDEEGNSGGVEKAVRYCSLTCLLWPISVGVFCIGPARAI